MASYSDYCSHPVLYAEDKLILRTFSGILAQFCCPIRQGERPSQLFSEEALTLLSGLGRFFRPAVTDFKDFRHTLALELEHQGHSNLLAHLLTLFAWLLRELQSVSPRCNTFKFTVELWKRMQAAFLPLLKVHVALPHPDNQPLHSIHSSFCQALIQTQPLQCLSKLLHAHRSNIETVWRAGAPEQQQADVLEAAVEGWCEAVNVATEMQTGLILSCCCNTEELFASSGLLEHMCALRLVLAEGLARLEGSKAMEETGAREQHQQQQRQLVQRLAGVLHGKDQLLMDMLSSASTALPIGWLDIEVIDTRVVVPQERSRQGSPVWPSLSHPAVQCLLGWWLVAPGLVWGWPGAGGWRLPEALGRDFRRIRDHDAKREGKSRDRRLAATALFAAARIWPALLRSGAPPPTPQQTAAAAAAPTLARGGDALAPEAVEGSSRAGAIGACRAGAPTDAGLVAASPMQPSDGGGCAPPFPLAYRPAHMYRVCYVVTEELGRRKGEYKTRGAWGCSFTYSAWGAGVELLADLLEFLPPRMAVGELPVVWPLVLSELRNISYCNEAAWCVGQMLSELMHLRAGLPGARGAAAASEAASRQTSAASCGSSGASGGGGGGGDDSGSGGGGDGDSSGDGGGSGGGGGGGGDGGGGSGGGGGGRGHGNGEAVSPGDTRPGAGVGVGAALSSPSHAPPPVVYCALAAGLLPSIEEVLRTEMDDPAQACYEGTMRIDLVLRRPGCWPALLAHGDPRQAAALVVSLAKVARAAAGMAPDEGTASACPVLRLQLLGLLEQLLVVQLQAGQGREPAAAMPGSGAGLRGGMGITPGPSGSGSGGQQEKEAQPDLFKQLLGLPLNRGLDGAASPDSVQAVAAGVRGEGPGAVGAGGEGSSGTPGHPSPPPSGNAGQRGRGLTLQKLAEASGCPAPGTTPQLQLARMAGQAAVEWLPVLLTRPAAAGAGGVEPAPMKDLLPHGAYRVAWAWLRLVAVQGLGPGGAGQEAWADFLLGPLAALQQVQRVLNLRGPCGIKGETDDVALELVKAVEEVLPAALDVLEVVAGARPGEVARALRENAEAREQLKRGMGWAPICWGPGISLDAGVIELLRRQGRGELETTLRRLAGERAAGSESGGSREGSGGGGREQVAGRVLAGSSVPPLPHPSEGEVILPRCGFAGCCGRRGRSEAEVTLQACGRCRAVGYCSRGCQVADWAAGHKAACGRQAGGGKEA